MRIGNREFDTENHTYVMGILNVTPDSFSDGGQYTTIDQALKQTEIMIDEGADLIDIGGESTRPGYKRITDAEEIERVIPVIRAVKSHFEIPISLDTYKSRVAKAGLENGVDLINDIWGLKHDSRMAKLIAKHDAACCLMHNRKKPDYQDFVTDWLTDIRDIIDIADTAGIARDKIILDPGVGFGKTYENNLAAIRNLSKLREMGFPLLLGTSRKSVIGQTLDVPVNERIIGTAVTTVFGVISHCSFVRVHDVKENIQAIKMAEAILRTWEENAKTNNDKRE